MRDQERAGTGRGWSNPDVGLVVVFLLSQTVQAETKSLVSLSLVAH